MTIKHRDGIYPEKEYYFENVEVQKEWLKFLDEFKENSIYNQYQIMEKIGAGNFSSVYRGVEKNTSKEVAVKVIEKQKLTESEKEVIKFEKSILELCHHPNIVRFNCDYSTKTRMYIVTELVRGGDLFELTKKYTFLEEYEAAIIFKQLVEAIKYLNVELGLIHRDLKP
jgi:serine/threonine protein kinase